MAFMRMSGIIWAISCSVFLLHGQPSNNVHHPFLWDREFSQSPNLYIPEIAVVDSHGVLWVLCQARMGNEGFKKQHITKAIFRLDEHGNQLSTSELDLPLSQIERQETARYQLVPFGNGEMGLVFNKIRFQSRGESYLGAYYTRLGTNGAGPLQMIAGPGPEYGSLLTLANGNLFLASSEGVLMAFDPQGAVRWKKSFAPPLMINQDSANLTDGTLCVSAWMLGKRGVLNKLRVMRLDQGGNALHIVDVDALRGQVAGGPEGSCAVLFDRAPNIYKGEYYLTAFDRTLGREWVVPVPRTSVPGTEFHLITLAEGYLAQIGNVIVEYGWSGKELWSDIEHQGQVRTIVAPTKDGFFIVTKDLGMNNGFHVHRATTTHD